MRVRRTALGGAASQPIAASCLGSGYITAFNSMQAATPRHNAAKPI